MFWCVNPLEASAQPPSFLCRKMLIQRCWTVRGQLIQHQNDLLGKRIAQLQALELRSKVRIAPSVGHRYRALTGVWFQSDEEIDNAAPLVFMIHPCWGSRHGWQWLSDVIQQLIRLFIEADDRP